MTTEATTNVTDVDSIGNSTDGQLIKNPALQQAYSILIPTILGVIMLSMGSGITWDDVKHHAKRPVAPAIGLLCQFIVMPACAFGMAHALRLESHHAIGMMVVASCPGGSVSNIFTYWSRGDLSLSICMTLLSTILSLGFLPLNLFIYLRSWTDDQASVPFVNMIISVAVTWIPVAIGLLIRYKVEKVGLYLVKIGSVAGMALILGAAVIQGQLYPEFFSLPWNIWIAAFFMPVIGFVIGFLISSIACLKLKMRKTVVFETGLQNTGLALTMISISYPNEYGNLLSQYPLFYAAGQMFTGVALVVLLNIYFCVHRCKSGKASISDEKESTKEENEMDVAEAPTDMSTSQVVLVESEQK